MTIYLYDTKRHAMVKVSATNEWPYAKLPPAVGAAKPKRRVLKVAIAVGVVATVVSLLASCTSAPSQPAPTTTASPSGITLPTVRKRAPMTPAERIQRVFEGTASQATGMAGSNASRAVRITDNAQINAVLGGIVSKSVTELRGWWRDQP